METIGGIQIDLLEILLDGIMVVHIIMLSKNVWIVLKAMMPREWDFLKQYFILLLINKIIWPFY